MKTHYVSEGMLKQLKKRNVNESKINDMIDYEPLDDDYEQY